MKLQWTKHQAVGNVTVYLADAVFRVYRVRWNGRRAWLHVRRPFDHWLLLGGSLSGVAEAQRLAQRIEDAR